MSATYAQSRAELINAFIPKAQRFVELIRNRHIQSYSQNWRGVKRYHPQKMDFGYVSDNFPVHHAEFTTVEIPGGKEGIKIWFNPWCYIAYYDIRERVGRPVHVTRGPATLLNSVPKGANRVASENKTNYVQPFTKTFKSEEGKGGSKDIGVRVSSSFRQTITAGGEAASFKSETELTTAVEASANMQNWYSTMLADETGWPGEVPPHTRRIVSRLLKVGRYQQQVTIDGELDASIYVLSRGDFDVRIDSFDELAALLSGVGNTGKGSHFGDWARIYSKYPIPAQHLASTIEAVAGSVNARYIEIEESDQASEEEFSWEDEFLPGHPNYIEIKK